MAVKLIPLPKNEKNLILGSGCGIIVLVGGLVESLPKILLTEINAAFGGRERYHMVLKVLEEVFSVCSLKEMPAVEGIGALFFLGKTDEEISLVCPLEAVPADVLRREDGWRAFRIEGVLDFSLIGILAQISAVLAAAEIGIFVVSTYNTDYILTKAEDFDAALAALAKDGYEISR